MAIEIVTPVVTTKTFSTSKVLTLLIVIAVLIGVFWFFWWKSEELQTKETRMRNIDIALHNTTPTQHFIDIPTIPAATISTARSTNPSSRRLVVDPYSSETVQVPMDKVIRSFSHLPTGERINDAFKVDSSQESTGSKADVNVSGVRSFIITHSGIFPERVLSRDVQLVNESNFPVMFVEKVRDFPGKRWSSEIIPPMTYITKDLVSPGSLYDVVHPTKEGEPITSIATPLKTSKMTFNGKTVSIR